jgi:hypothetical protein
MWGRDPVHPSDEACGVIAKAIEEDILNSEVRYEVRILTTRTT